MVASLGRSWESRLMADLTGVWAKIHRADEHLATLDASLQLWGNSNPSAITGHPNADKTEHRFVVSLKVPPDLTRWGLLVGDCVHNLRSALDHLTWELAGSPEGQPGSARIQFPIFKCEARFRAAGGGMAQIKGINDADQRALFCRVQPWQNPDGVENDGLWLIHEFDRVDKHQVLTPILMLPRELMFNMVIEYADPATAAKAPQPVFVPGEGPLRDGAEAFSLHFAVPPVKVKMNAGYSLGVAIEYAGHRGGVTGTLGNLCQHARRIAEEFRDLL